MSTNREPVVIDMPPPQTSLSAAESRTSIALETATFVGMLIVLIVGPLLFGTTEIWSQLIQRAFAIVILMLWVWRQLSRGEIELTRNPIYLPAAIFGLLGAIQFVSGWTAYRHATLQELTNLGVYLVLIITAGETLTRRRRLRIFVLALAVFGIVLALISVLQDASGTDKIYGFRTVTSISAAIYGPYANHNHYAGLMEMLVPLTFAAALLEEQGKRFLLLFGALIMTVSIILSGSRGGTIAIAAGLLFGFVMWCRLERNGHNWFALVGMLTVLAAAVLMLGTDKVQARLTQTEDLYRLQIGRDTLHMSAHKPIIGFGLGTFQFAYPRYQSFSDEKLVNHAHNDYLETLAETGVIGFGCFVWLMVMVFRAGFAKIREQADEEGRLLTLGALTGLVGVLVHSFLDFNLRITANAALFFVLCSAVATPFKRKIQPLSVQPWSPESEMARGEN